MELLVCHDAKLDGVSVMARAVLRPRRKARPRATLKAPVLVKESWGTKVGIRQSAAFVRVQQAVSTAARTSLSYLLPPADAAEPVDLKEEYLEVHGLLQYMEQLLHQLLQSKPADPYRFMLDELTATVSSGAGLRDQNADTVRSRTDVLNMEAVCWPRSSGSHTTAMKSQPTLAELAFTHVQSRTTFESPVRVTPISPTLESRPEPPLSPPREHEHYKPISLDNCNQVITNLFLGGVTSATDTARLSAEGIRAVVCCCREMEFPTKDFGAGLEYYRVDVEDVSMEPIEFYFSEATKFIHSWVSREQRVLVHCRAGVSRSASVVLAYLLQYQKYSLHDALFLTRAKRPAVTPNLGFMEKLCAYEEEHRQTEATIDMLKYEEWFNATDRPAVPDLSTD